MPRGAGSRVQDVFDNLGSIPDRLFDKVENVFEDRVTEFGAGLERKFEGGLEAALDGPSMFTTGALVTAASLVLLMLAITQRGGRAGRLGSNAQQNFAANFRNFLSV